MGFEKVDKDIIKKGLAENLKLKINRLEEAAKIGHLGSFIHAIVEYNNINQMAQTSLETEYLEKCNKKVFEIFNHISSMGTGKYWS